MSTDVTQQHPAGPPGTDEEPRTSWISRHRRLVVIGSAAALLIGGGAAYAWWSSTGQGDTTVDTGDAPNFVVTASPGTGGPLSPDGPFETIAFTVANPSDGVLNLGAITVDVANPDGTPWTVPGCSAADFAIEAPTVTLGEIAAGDDVDGTVRVQMINRPVNQDGCKGVTNVPVRILAS